MTTIRVIDNGEFKTDYAAKLGSLMFPAEYYDCKHHVNTTKLRKNLEKEGIVVLKGAKLLRVLVPTTNNANFKNEQNTKVPYKHPICASQTDAGAYPKHYPEMNYTAWVSDYPLGDAIVVFNIVPHIKNKCSQCDNIKEDEEDTICYVCFGWKTCKTCNERFNDPDNTCCFNCDTPF